jgi:Flp pilus assembly protein TadD
MTAEHAQLISKMGCELAGAGRLEEARVLFAGLVASNPKHAAAHAALGTVLQKLGKLPEAKASYDLALGLDPRNPVALANRGELRLKSGDRAGLEDLTLAVQADPECTTAAVRRAREIIKVIVQYVDLVRASPLERSTP